MESDGQDGDRSIKRPVVSKSHFENLSKNDLQYQDEIIIILLYSGFKSINN